MNIVSKSLLVGAMALAATGAQARVASPALSGFESDPLGSEFFLSVYNAEGQISYALDLGIRTKDFDPTKPLSFNISSNAFLSFMAATSAGQSLVYSVVGANTFFSDLPDLDYLGLFVTSKGEPALQDISGFATSSAKVAQRIDQLNSRSGQLTGTNQQTGNKAVNLDSFSTPGQAAYYPVNWGANLDDTFGSNVAVSAGEAAEFWWLSQPFDDELGDHVPTATLLGYWNFTVAGNTANLEFAPVPVPAAVWLFGTGLMGLLAAKRRKA
ncbi:PEP-CTERM sorting domain-containing protein [Methylicorpusculum sp.]|uniref:PEP-CTERM sorting domain-containing protein n=1 Tax=Methylicorpusculum sp. TaxID=2713644 RepID=UPI0027307E63|nr:PEP-CTERM sorting domain-containing protein [Methylicorpusculum sp.]MDP2177146.1 PEP-CTERM sorting domain-containing protein [Methylicorpusculum sp.]MDP3531289.1 PEP-CTERM sorting domain-containing protein [Methylicorpusculum sp.]MDZ4153235.1 PEP-CTERM sorting domain-containing protein [Methylicorpusculum sp.]